MRIIVSCGSLWSGADSPSQQMEFAQLSWRWLDCHYCMWPKYGNLVRVNQVGVYVDVTACYHTVCVLMKCEMWLKALGSGPWVRIIFCLTIISEVNSELSHSTNLIMCEDFVFIFRNVMYFCVGFIWRPPKITFNWIKSLWWFCKSE